MRPCYALPAVPWSPPGVLRELARRFGCGEVFHGRTLIGDRWLRHRRRVLITVVHDVEVRIVHGRRVCPQIAVEWDRRPERAAFQLPPGGPDGWAEHVAITRSGLHATLDRPGGDVPMDELEQGIRWLARAACTTHREMSFLRALPGAVPPTPGPFTYSFLEPESASGHQRYVMLPTRPRVRAWPGPDPDTFQLTAGPGTPTVLVPPPPDAARLLAIADELARDARGD